jgi:serine phosphatase RsbU (regulator of sigma subunit)
MICVEHNTPGRYFTDEIFDIVTSLSVYAEIMISNISVHREILEKRELDRDISITSGIQKSLLPSRIPSSDKYTFAVYSAPAKYVGGLLRFYKLKSGKIAFSDM